MALRCETLRARLQTPLPYEGHLIYVDEDECIGVIHDYAPATEAQLQLTEERLGFALPSALRMLYSEVANGGDLFRDGYFVYGAVGGYPDFPSPDGAKTIDQMVSYSGWRLSERVANALRRHPGVYVECEDSPDRFVAIANMGCGESLALDGWTGRLYIHGCGQSMHEYRASLGLPIEPDTEDICMQTFSFFASSVEEWIESKLSGTPLPYYSHTGASGELAQEMLRDGDA